MDENMIEKRFNRMEEMLSTLIRMVGNINERLDNSVKEQQEMKLEMSGLKEEQQLMKRELVGLKEEQLSMKEVLQSVQEQQHMMQAENDKNFALILDKLSENQADQDFIWDKAVKNEREIAKIKVHLQP